MPSNERELVRAFATNNLGGLPTENFAGFVWRKKFLRFKQFVAALPHDEYD